MSYRLVYFLSAAAMLLAMRIAMWWARRRGRPLFSGLGTLAERWSLFDLVLASFLTLFAELAFIRWIAVEIRVFAYFKNHSSMVICSGFVPWVGIGGASPAQERQYFGRPFS